MWQWRSFAFLLLIYKHSTSQPITEDTTNDRPTRQLNFKDCCPCWDDVKHDSLSEEPLGAGSAGVFSSPRDVDDCPCKPRTSDSEGASSVFFPTAMRAAGTFLRPNEKKEDLKPIFNPEVDLASSVLETLREVTDEEYQDALARDAAKSAARVAEDFVFGDTTPQESANVVTIVVNPRRSLSDDDDALPQASHLQQTRCISPLQSARSSLGKMRVAPKSILHKTRQPKLKNRLLHRNFYDMDSGMSPSNVHENIVPIDEETGERSSGASPLRILEGKNRLVATNSGTDDCDPSETPKFQLNLERNLAKPSLLNSIRDKNFNSLSRLPKLTLKNLITDTANNDNNGDLSSAPSTIHEQATKKISYFRNNLPLQNNKPKMPLSIPNLLNLRDVEVIPLKDLIMNQANNDKRNRSKLGLPSLLNRHDTGVKFSKDTEGPTNRDNTQLTLKNNADDAEVSPSQVNIRVSPKDTQVSSENCDGELSEKDASANEDNTKETEIIDTASTNKQDIKPKMPLSIPNLLKFKDMKEIPLKKLFNQANNGKFDLTSLLKRHHTGVKFNEDTKGATNRGNTQLVFKSNADDSDVSPSVVNIRVSPKDDQVSSENCEVELSEKGANIIKNNVKPPSTGIIDTASANKQDIKPKMPFSIPNLLNQRDVQVPLKDLIINQTNNGKRNKVKLGLPSLLNRHDTSLKINKDTDGPTNRDKTQFTLKNNADDSEVSPSLMNIHVSPKDQVSSQKCEEKLLEKDANAMEYNVKPTSIEIIDTVSANKQDVKLKDAEVTPLKGLITNEANNGKRNEYKLGLPSLLNRHDTSAKINKDTDGPTNRDKTQFILKNNADDSEVSPSLMNIHVSPKDGQVGSQKCEEELLEKDANAMEYNVKPTSIEIIDTVSANKQDVKLKDVEVTPSKGLITNQANNGKRNKYKLGLPSLLNRHDTSAKINKDTDGPINRDKTQSTLKNNADDSEVSPSLMNIHVSPKDGQVRSQNCEEELLEKDANSNEDNVKPTSTEIIGTASSNKQDVKLKDTEVIPLKGLITKQANNAKRNKYKLGLPSLLNRHDTSAITNEDTKSPTNRDSTQFTLENNADEPEVSPSLVNIRVSPKDGQGSTQNCEGELLDEDANAMENNVKPTTTEIIDTASTNKQDVELKDVDDISLKDLMTNQSNNGKQNKSKPGLTSILNHHDTGVKINKGTEGSTNRDNTQFTLKNNADDPEVSPSLMNIRVSPKDDQVSSESCEGERSEKDVNVIENNTKPISTEIIDTAPITINETNDCLDENNENQDKITDAKEHIEVDNFKSSEDQQGSKGSFNESCDQDEEIIDNSVKPKLKLLDASAVDKTLSNLKENIAKKLEDLKNRTSLKNIKVFSQKAANDDANIPMDNNANQNEDCENFSSIQVTTFATEILNKNSEVIITTLKPDSTEQLENNINSPNGNIPSNEVEETTECFDKAISMQDLQKLSDSMLEQEEQERESEPLDYSKSLEEMIDTSEYENRDVDQIDLNEPVDTPIDNVVESDNLVNIQINENDDDACKSNLAKSSLQLLPDSNVEASDLMPNVVFNDNHILSSSPILQPALTIVNPLPNINDVLKLSPLNPLPTLDDIKEKLTGLFDTDNREVAEMSPIDPINEPEMWERSNSVMATDASKSFYTRLSPTKHLEEVNFDILELKPHSIKLPTIPKIGLHSYKAKLPLPKHINLKPIKLQSALENKRGLLGATLSIGKNSNPLNVLNNPLDVLPSLKKDNDHLDLPLEASNIHSTLRKAHKTLEAKLRKAKNNFSIKKPYGGSDLLETISRNHEDINDKLKGLHSDLNDRLETMRNDLLDRTKLLTSGSHNVLPNFRSSSKFNIPPKNKKPLHHTWQASTRRGSQKLSTSRKPIKKPAKTNTQLKHIEQRLRMPAAASVPVPKTVDVPELKATPEKSLPFVSARTPNMSPYRNDDTPPTSPLVRQSSAVIGKQTNPTNQKVKVSFSTTSRPEMMNERFRSSLPRDQKNNNAKSHGHFRSKITHRDNDESPSEIIKTETAVPTFDNTNEPKLTELDSDDRSNILPTETNHVKISDSANNRKNSGVRSWPRVNESFFLKKVKEAVQARLSKIDSVKTAKQNGPPESELDMTHSASENKESIIDASPLTENVSYKCSMVCTKE